MPTRKTKKSKKQSGKGVKEVLSAVHDFVKNNKLISKGLSATGMVPLGVAADLIGYGKKKRRTRRVAVQPTMATSKAFVVPRRRLAAHGQRGNGFFSDLGGGIGSVFGGLGGGIGSVAHGLFGSGRPATAKRSVISI